MKLKNYSQVRIITDRFEHEGVKKGTIGFVIEIYEDGEYEVEISDSKGITLAQITTQECEIEPYEASVIQ
jgi:hypothetical protein